MSEADIYDLKEAMERAEMAQDDAVAEAVAAERARIAAELEREAGAHWNKQVSDFARAFAARLREEG